MSRSQSSWAFFCLKKLGLAFHIPKVTGRNHTADAGKNRINFFLPDHVNMPPGGLGAHCVPVGIQKNFT
ncbi:MAG: hypothetical protein JW810_07470 [Sedimentisphaerales bacterium]|nr:hypothetical protein [Sedimentisphaerales bacterium]